MGVFFNLFDLTTLLGVSIHVYIYMCTFVWLHFKMISGEVVVASFLTSLLYMHTPRYLLETAPEERLSDMKSSQEIDHSIGKVLHKKIFLNQKYVTFSSTCLCSHLHF